MTYAPLKTGAAATLGTSGDAVKALQAQLNATNNGKAGYVPLAVDGKYGPLTQAATAYKAPASAPTIGSVYNLPGTQTDPAAEAAGTAADAFYQKQAAGQSPVDEAAIRQNTLKQFQAEIDATNEIYTRKLNEAKIAGTGRLGSNTAIQARRGLLGSDFGAADTEKINKGNQDVYSGIDAEKANAIQVILGKANKSATDEIAAKTKAISDGLDAHLKYLTEAGARKKTKAAEAAAFILNQKLSPGDLTPEQLAQTATGYGVSADEIKSSFLTLKKTADEEAAKKALEQQKALPASAQEYEYAKKNGYKGSYTQYQNDDANRKALATRPLGTLAERDRAVVDKVSSLFSPGYTIPGSSGVPYIDGVNKYATPEGFKTAFKASGLNRKTFLTELGYLVAPGLETAYGITPAEIKIINGELPAKDGG